ncbi:AAEL012820-PA [Aedes aegypti]|uniref:Complex I assembly factor TIMMDC1, mitochondrial n=1 Tax=Aedes aegypti TaxID=7159 RepID=Q16KZ3_AEDAE|nr:AAEL012820-PA [Aedes aegypti]
MFRRVAKFAVPGAGFISAGLFPFGTNENDRVEHTPMQKMLAEAPGDKQTGKDRLYLMFSIDEFGRVSSELNSIYQAGFLGFLVGACYGGFVNSRVAYMNFMERNQATAFKSSFEAKRKLQDQVTVTFAKGAFKWGWRLALFTTSYIGIQTVISVYRGKSSIYEYLVAGGTTGALYKFSMGPKGMVSGGLVGMAFGGIAGLASLAILRASGTTMEEVRFWQYKWKASRDEAINESLKVQSSEESDQLLDGHHRKFGTANITLDNIAAGQSKVDSSVSQKDVPVTEKTEKK